MIHLTDDLYIGKGRTRRCFVDPRDPSYCIKIDHTGFKSTLKEADYYKKLARIKPDLRYDFIPHFHGIVETNLGPGGVFDLIRDADGNVSRNLGDYFYNGTIARERPRWEKALNVFLSRLMETGVILRDLNMANIAVQKSGDGSIRFVAIDGIGHRDFIPLCDYFLRFARRRIRRSVERKGMNSIQGLYDYAEMKARRRAAAAV